MQRIAVNLGCGKHGKPGWHNIDFIQRAGVTVRQDLQANPVLGFMDGSVSVIFTSHFLEHVPAATADKLLKECYRILAPGGVLRIAVPDVEAAVAAYRKNDHSYFDDGEQAMPKAAPIWQKLAWTVASDSVGGVAGPPVTQDFIEMLLKTDSLVPGLVAKIRKNSEYTSHQNGYTFETLKKALHIAGFREVTRESFGSSRMPELQGMDMHPKISLYVEARR